MVYMQKMMRCFSPSVCFLVHSKANLMQKNVGVTQNRQWEVTVVWISSITLNCVTFIYCLVLAIVGDVVEDRPRPSCIYMAAFDENRPDFIFAKLWHAQKAALVGLVLTSTIRFSCWKTWFSYPLCPRSFWIMFLACFWIWNGYCFACFFGCLFGIWLVYTSDGCGHPCSRFGSIFYYHILILKCITVWLL